MEKQIGSWRPLFFFIREIFYLTDSLHRAFEALTALKHLQKIYRLLILAVTLLKITLLLFLLNSSLQNLMNTLKPFLLLTNQNGGQKENWVQRGHDLDPLGLNYLRSYHYWRFRVRYFLKLKELILALRVKHFVFLSICLWDKFKRNQLFIAYLRVK